MRSNHEVSLGHTREQIPSVFKTVSLGIRLKSKCPITPGTHESKAIDQGLCGAIPAPILDEGLWRDEFCLDEDEDDDEDEDEGGGGGEDEDKDADEDDGGDEEDDDDEDEEDDDNEENASNEL
jgi:hypothetical protein